MFLAQRQEVTDNRVIATLLVANDLVVANSQLIADRDGTSGRITYCFGIEINSRISSKVLWSESLAVDLTVGLAAVAEVDVKVF